MQATPQAAVRTDQLVEGEVDPLQVDDGARHDELQGTGEAARRLEHVVVQLDGRGDAAQHFPDGLALRPVRGWGGGGQETSLPRLMPILATPSVALPKSLT